MTSRRQRACAQVFSATSWILLVICLSPHEHAHTPTQTHTLEYCNNFPCWKRQRRKKTNRVRRSFLLCGWLNWNSMQNLIKNCLAMHKQNTTNTMQSLTHTHTHSWKMTSNFRRNWKIITKSYLGSRCCCRVVAVVMVVAAVLLVAVVVLI